VRILWIKAGGFLPADSGGKIRSLETVRQLAKNHEVTVFTFYGEHDDDQHEGLSEIVSTALCVPIPLAPRGSSADLMGFAGSVLRGRPHTLWKYYSPKVEAGLRRIVGSQPFDVIVCDFLTPAGLIDWDCGIPTVLFTHNVEARIWERLYKVTPNPLLRLASYLEYKALARAERRYVKQADEVLTVAQTDRDFFVAFVDPDRVTSISTGVDLTTFQPNPSAEVPKNIVFTGSMDWLPNEDGVLWFVQEIFPRIRTRVPEATFTIVGRRPSGAVKALEKEDGVLVTGTVAEIPPYLHQGSVYVVPIRSGSGTRLKIFEAMAAGKAIVSTTIGAEGLPVEHGTNVRLADTVEAFADEVVDLLGSTEDRARLGSNARTLVEERFGWPAVSAEVEAVLLRAASRDR